MEKIAEQYETKSLIIKNASMQECDKLQKICKTWDDKKLIEGSEYTNDYIYTCLTKGDLPPIPNASKDNLDWYVYNK